MLDVDGSVLSKHISAQIERLQAAEKDGDASTLKQEISRTRAIIAISKRIILHSYYVRKLCNMPCFTIRDNNE